MKKILPLEKGDFYFSPEGYRVFTEQYHIKRGVYEDTTVVRNVGLNSAWCLADISCR